MQQLALTLAAVTLGGCALIGADPQEVQSGASEPITGPEPRVEATRAASPSRARQLRVARYSLLDPAQRDALTNPLQRVVELHFDDGIATVGDAVRRVLHSSGYRLARGIHAPDAQNALLSRQLPAAYRELGPMPLEQALLTLGRPGHDLLVDHLHRRIAYAVTSRYADYE